MTVTLPPSFAALQPYDAHKSAPETPSLVQQRCDTGTPPRVPTVIHLVVRCSTRAKTCDNCRSYTTPKLSEGFSVYIRVWDHLVQY